MNNKNTSLTQLGVDIEQILIKRLPAELKRDAAKCQNFLMSLDTHLEQTPALDKIRNSNNPDVQGSLVDAAGMAFYYALPLGIHSYILPIGGRAVFCPGYKGIIEVWRRVPGHNIKSPKVVYTNDYFKLKDGINGGKDASGLEHEPYLEGDRGDVKGIYVIWSYHEHCDYLYMTIDELEDYKEEVLSKLPKGVYSAWHTHPLQMMKKTVIKQAAKYGNTNPDVSHVIHLDDQTEFVQAEIENEVETKKSIKKSPPKSLPETEKAPPKKSIKPVSKKAAPKKEEREVSEEEKDMDNPEPAKEVKTFVRQKVSRKSVSEESTEEAEEEEENIADGIADEEEGIV